MTKHRYTNAEAPTNTGSLSRPARFNLRLDCETRARTLKLFSETREMIGLSKENCYADVWQRALLPLCEHALWHLKESPTAMKSLILSLYGNLPKEDWVRNRYAALRARFEPKARAASPDGRACPTSVPATPTQGDLFADSEED